VKAFLAFWNLELIKGRVLEFINMPILAALISRGTTVLVEYCPSGNNFPQIARRLIEQIPSTPDSKKSYSYENYNFNYLVEGGITYICMTDQEMGLRVPYAFLFDINSRFKAAYQQKLSTASSMEMKDVFSRVIRDRIEFFSNDKNADKISKVKGEIEEAKTIMVKNIDKVLERGDRIEVLVSKTEDLHSQSESFQKKSTSLKRKLCCQNAKITFILICVIVTIIVGASLVACWKLGVFDDLLHHDKSSSSSSSSTSTSTSSSSSSTSSTSGVATTGVKPTTGIIATTGQGTTGHTAMF